MVGGQARDLAATNQTLQLDELATLHQCKTGALIRASVQLGALAAPGVTSSQLTQLDHYAKAIGYAFQIQDDILDIEVSTAHLGKQQGADIALNKSTYPKLMGLSSAKEKIRELHQEALHALHQFDDRATLLRQLSEYVITRDH
jgi:geranylgeranyl pyrophosphate synthase